MSYFTGHTDVNEIKNLYRDLIFQCHPDRHPQSEFARWNSVTQQLNAEYHDALLGAHGQTHKGDDGKDHTYYYRRDVEQVVIDKLDELLRAHLPESVTIWLIGTWIWVEGTRKDDLTTRNKLTTAKLMWHSKRGMWYFRTCHSRSSYSGKSFDDLKRTYDAIRVDRDDEQSSAQAFGA